MALSAIDFLVTGNQFGNGAPMTTTSSSCSCPDLQIGASTSSPTASAAVSMKKRPLSAGGHSYSKMAPTPPSSPSRYNNNDNKNANSGDQSPHVALNPRLAAAVAAAGGITSPRRNQQQQQQQQQQDQTTILPPRSPSSKKSSQNATTSDASPKKGTRTDDDVVVAPPNNNEKDLQQQQQQYCASTMQVSPQRPATARNNNNSNDSDTTGSPRIFRATHKTPSRRCCGISYTAKELQEKRDGKGFIRMTKIGEVVDVPWNDPLPSNLLRHLSMQSDRSCLDFWEEPVFTSFSGRHSLDRMNRPIQMGLPEPGEALPLSERRHRAQVKLIREQSEALDILPPPARAARLPVPVAESAGAYSGDYMTPHGDGDNEYDYDGDAQYDDYGDDQSPALTIPSATELSMSSKRGTADSGRHHHHRLPAAHQHHRRGATGQHHSSSHSHHHSSSSPEVSRHQAEMTGAIPTWLIDRAGQYFSQLNNANSSISRSGKDINPAVSSSSPTLDLSIASTSAAAAAVAAVVADEKTGSRLSSFRLPQTTTGSGGMSFASASASGAMASPPPLKSQQQHRHHRHHHTTSSTTAPSAAEFCSIPRPSHSPRALKQFMVPPSDLKGSTGYSGGGVGGSKGSTPRRGRSPVMLVRGEPQPEPSPFKDEDFPSPARSSAPIKVNDLVAIVKRPRPQSAAVVVVSTSASSPLSVASPASSHHSPGIHRKK